MRIMLLSMLESHILKILGVATVDTNLTVAGSCSE
jgi:hypothetical protein